MRPPIPRPSGDRARSAQPRSGACAGSQPPPRDPTVRTAHGCPSPTASIGEMGLLSDAEIPDGLASGTVAFDPPTRRCSRTKAASLSWHGRLRCDVSGRHVGSPRGLRTGPLDRALHFHGALSRIAVLGSPRNRPNEPGGNAATMWRACVVLVLRFPSQQRQFRLGAGRGNHRPRTSRQDLPDTGTADADGPTVRGAGEPLHLHSPYGWISMTLPISTIRSRVRQK
jgi:hypothetical protein